ncbi:MAG: Ldh family oxidoreductase [Limnochordia bacterium]|jgi:LDH2 family malate/lactate/ureidoglycolate dehydrogenase
MDGYLVSPPKLIEFSRQILIQVGMPEEDATLVAESLVEADQRGVSSHGIIRLPFYVRKLRAGGTKARPNISIVREGISSGLVDGDSGMGQVVATYAMDLAIKKAKETGVACIGVRNSEHFGAAARYAMMAARQDMIGITWSNGPPVMAPWGGKAAAMGNQPLAIAVPAKGKPIVLDMAMSVVAGGKVRMAAKKGEKIPNSWIVNKEGRFSENPNDLPEGALLPIGYKGYGLAVMGEVLTGVLTGAGILSEVLNWLFNPTEATRTGHMMMAIDIAAYLSVDEFKMRLEQMSAELRNTPKAEGFDRILLPGDLENEREEELREGYLVSEPVYKDLEKLADEYDVALNILKD